MNAMRFNDERINRQWWDKDEAGTRYRDTERIRHYESRGMSMLFRF